jgi:polyisoprenoid-binding protein YceI
VRNGVKWALAALVGLGVAIPLGVYVYFNVLTDDAPERLTLQPAASASAAPSSAAPTTSTQPVPAGNKADLTGTWQPTPESQVGYRVNEVAFGQRKAAVGRTNAVSGTMTADGTTITAVDLTVDMTTVASDQSRRDGQFQGRIMDTASHPNATFKLTQPLRLDQVPADTTPVNVKATGDLTLRGTTKNVTFDLQAQRRGDGIAVAGSLPVVFADWGIPNPSIGPISTEDHGELELLVVFARA